MVIVLRINRLKIQNPQAQIECTDCGSLLLIDKDECVYLPSDDISSYPNRYKVLCPICNSKLILYNSHFHELGEIL
jgi:Zn finger protein HypA/HybF involved in hydrogenase expression